MSLTSIAEWDDEYARLARSASQLRSGVGGNTMALQQGLQRLEAVLPRLPLAQAEIQRRQRLVQHLQQTSTPGGGGGGGMHTPGGAASSVVSGSSAGQGAPPSQMQVAMDRQDAMIDDLAVGVGRLKQQTHAIHDEAGMHVNLINDMDVNLDVAQQSLEDETRRAMRLREDQSVWKLQLIVAGQVIVLVLLIFLGLT